MPQFSHIYFDLDGTLVNTTDGIIKAYLYLHDRYSLQKPPLEEMRRWIGPPVRTVIRHFLGESKTAEEIETGVSVMREYYFAQGWSECELYEGMNELLQKAHHRDLILSVVTSKNIVMAKKVLHHVGIDTYFTEIFGPPPELDREKGAMLSEIVARQKADPEKSLMIGDSKYDIDAACHVGMRAIGVTYGFTPPSEMENLSPWKICLSPTSVLQTILEN